MLSDLCDRGECETCFEDELDACGHECHPPDCLTGSSRPTTQEPSTGGARQAQDPAASARAPVAPRRAARATVPGRPRPPAAPPKAGGRGGETSPQLRRERAAAGTPGPETGAGGRRTGSSAPVRARSNTPAGGALDADGALSAGSTGRTWTLEFPAGMELLSLNGREHWAARNRKTQALKQAAWVLAKRAKIPLLERASITVEYQPPDRRRRDADNTCAASGKACADGLVAAGVLLDDECPRYVTGIWCTIGERYPKGRLVLHITEVESSDGERCRVSDLVIDPFAGPGGWSWAARQLGIEDVGIELDAAACATRAAAGLKTIRANVAAFPVEQLAGKVWGLIASPPCTTFSAAGDGAGNAVTDLLAGLIRDMFAGKDTREDCRRAMTAELEAAQWPDPEMEPAKRAAKIAKAVQSAALVAEPARFVAACRPEWVALEQVPSVLPLWQVYAAELRRMGYSAWTGVLNAADYGVPQVRERAFLIASRAHQASRPESTHYDPRKGGQLWGEPWVTMADALGWGMTERPFFTLPTAGGDRGGADVGGSGARKSLYAERDAGRWVFERPATTVLADSRLGRPGHKGRERGGEAHFAVGSVRLTPAQAAVLQSFPADYPFAGSATKAHQQIGNAVPPLLAEHVLAMATGIRRMEAAA